MLRVFVAIMTMAALALPAMAYNTTWDGDPEGDITIELQIDCWIQVLRQDAEIHFTDQSPFDWYNTSPTGAYTKCPDTDNQHPMYPWAGDHWYAPTGMYYESDDGAVIYVQSNNALTMNVHTNGDLTGTLNSPFGTIPTWFTIAMCPFTIGGVPVAGHTVPFCGNPGCYLSGPAGGGLMTICGAGDFPNQHMFPCAPASQVYTTGSMAPQVFGTIKFLCRIHRNGMMDGGDLYTTWLDVDFTSP
jgi:hypothetical protein